MGELNFISTRQSARGVLWSWVYMLLMALARSPLTEIWENVEFARDEAWKK